MEIKNFVITKRDGTKDAFSLDKIMNAIIKAFNSVGENVDLTSLSKIISNLAFTTMVISLPSFEKILPFFASAAPFARLIVAQWL